MKEQHAYKCGHRREVPEGMGRGAARQKRIAEYFDRPCFSCWCDGREIYIAALSEVYRDEEGKLHSRTLTQAERDSKLAAYAEKVRRVYL